MVTLLNGTALTDDTIVQHGVLQTGVMFLQKPFTSARLSRKVAEVLAGL